MTRPVADATALGVGALAYQGTHPTDFLPDSRPSAVYEPRISAGEAADRLGTFRAAVAALLPRAGAGAGAPG